MADNNGQRSDAELGELAAFADGSLSPAARVRLPNRVEPSPELRALVEEQRRAKSRGPSRSPPPASSGRAISMTAGRLADPVSAGA
jgi:hypothetical protein